MISLRRSLRRPAVFRKSRGQITIWLALSFLVFLGLYEACMQSAWKGYERQKAERAVQAGVFSLFSEYEPHLFQKYDFLGVDTSFQSGREQTEKLCSHLWHFTELNAGKLSMQGVNLKEIVRLTDGKGSVFYHQAIRIMKEKTGASLAEDWLFDEGLAKDMEEDAARYLDASEELEEKSIDYEEEDEDAEETIQEWEELRENFWLSMVLPREGTLSRQAVDLSGVPSARELSQGIGNPDGTEQSLLSKQWFIGYLCDYFSDAEEMLHEGRESSGYLDYQLEYIICGNASDQENLEQIVGRLLLLREGANYVFLQTHSDYREKAELLATILGTLLLAPESIEVIEQLILLGWSYAESVVEVRQLLQGQELSVVKQEEDWQVPLSSALSLAGDPGKYDVQAHKQQGLGYQSYLKIFLNLTSWDTLSMRGLDIVEGVVRQMDATCRNFHVDHCMEQVTAQVWIQDMYLERIYRYE